MAPLTFDPGRAQSSDLACLTQAAHDPSPTLGGGIRRLKSLGRSEDRLAFLVLDLLPALLNRPDDLCGHRNEVKLLGHLAALCCGPCEDLERFCGVSRFLRLLVDENESGAGDRPGGGTGSIRQDHAEARCAFPVSACSGGRERISGRLDYLAVLVRHLGMGEL